MTRHSKTDAYLVLQKILEIAHSPDSWNDLIAETKSEINRLEKAAQAEI